ncbi:MAG: PIN domain-containing protein [archaeon]
MTDSELFLDSSIWLGYFLGNNPKTKQIIDNESNILFTSIISIHEVFKKLLALNKTSKEAFNAIKFIENNSAVIYINKEIALAAAINCGKYKLHTIDSLIYSSAIKTKSLFVTADKDFKSTPKTKLIKIEY